MTNNLEELYDERLAKIKWTDFKLIKGMEGYNQRNFYNSSGNVEFNKNLLIAYNTFVILSPMIGTFVYAVFSNKI